MFMIVIDMWIFIRNNQHLRFLSILLILIETKKDIVMLIIKLYFQKLK